MAAKPIAQCRVFIGSSSEGLEVANTLQELLVAGPHGTLAKVWNQGVTVLSSTTIESLIRSAHEVDFGVFVLTPDDLVNSRGNESSIPRDNVLFELGLFMGTLGRDRVFVVYQANVNTKVLSDLSGVTLATFSMPDSLDDLAASLGPAVNKIRAQVRSVGTRRYARKFASPDEAHRYMYQLMEDDEVRTIQHLAVSNVRFTATPTVEEFAARVQAFLARPGTRYWYLYRDHGDASFREDMAARLLKQYPRSIEVRRANGEVFREPGLGILIFGQAAAMVIDQHYLGEHEFRCLTEPGSVKICHRLFRVLWDDYREDSGHEEASSTGSRR